MTPLIEVDRLTVRFGGLTAVDGLSFCVEQGRIHGLIGPNGAGKTTTFNAISGFQAPTAGEIRLRSARISGLAMHKVARLGLVRTFQHSTLFAELTVLENALIGTHMRLPTQRRRGHSRPRCWRAARRRGAGPRIPRILRTRGAGG